MIRFFSHTITILFVSFFITSCNSHHNEFPEETESTEISFSFSADKALLSRSSNTRSTNDQIDQYDVMFDINSIQVLVIATENEQFLDEVKDISVVQLPNGNYLLNGSVTKVKDKFKIVMLVNCEPVGLYYDAAFYQYDPLDHNPFADKKKAIPLWGELVSSVALQPGSTTFIGTVSMTRAMAKVEVALSGQSNGYELTEVTMNYYNSRGHLVPNSDINNPRIPGSAIAIGNASFIKVDNTKFIIYLPEYKNEGLKQLSMKIKLKDATGIHERDLLFGNYQQSEFINPSHILRNHHYKYNIFMKRTKSENFHIDISTEESLMGQ